MGKLPSFQFYPADWRKDPGVQSLSYHDRGVWHEMLCLMHESEERGKLTLNGHPMPDDALAQILGLDKQILTTTITTLLTRGVASREPSGALLCRRMVRDDNLRKIRANSGKMGGNPVLLKQNTTTQVKQSATPSSSSSSSSSDVPEGHYEPRIRKGSVISNHPPNDLMDAVTMVSNSGVPEDFATMVYSKWSERNRCDGAGVQVDWRKHVEGRWMREGTQWKNGTHNRMASNGNHANSTLQIKLIEEQISQHKANSESVYYDSRCTDLERSSLKALKIQLKDLKSRISNVQH